MTVYPYAATKLVAAGILAIQRRRYEHLCREGADHAHRLAETINEPWLYRGATS